MNYSQGDAIYHVGVVGVVLTAPGRADDSGFFQHLEVGCRIWLAKAGGPGYSPRSSAGALVRAARAVAPR